MRSVEPIEVPPYLCTIKAMGMGTVMSGKQTHDFTGRNTG
jgi:hypothetical protein